MSTDVYVLQLLRDKLARFTNVEKISVFPKRTYPGRRHSCSRESLLKSSVLLTSVHSAHFYTENIISICYKTGYPNEEVNCNQPSPTITPYLILKISFNFAIKQATLMRRSTVVSLPLQLVFRGCSIRGVLKLMGESLKVVLS
jgi:hypothetical protein